MNLSLAFLVSLRPPGYGRHIETTAAMDWFVLATLGFFFFLLGCFATWAWLLWRRSQRPEPHVRLMMELEEDEGARGGPKKPEKPERARSEEKVNDPWERPPDWWKK